MPIKVKKNGAYSDASVFVKKGGAYAAAQLFVKSAGAYVLASASPAIALNATGMVQAPQSLRTFTTSTNYGINRTLKDIRLAGDQVKLVFCNKYLNGYVETNGAGAVTILQAAWEYGGVTYPVYFGGSRSITLNPGDVDISSDWFNCTMTAGTSGYLRIKWSATSGWPSGEQSDGTTVSYQYAPANDLDQVDNTGTLTAPTGATSASYPFTVTGIVVMAASTAKSVFGLGSSLLAGTGDWAPNAINKTNGNGAGGFLRRAAYLASLPLAQHCVPGRSATNEASGSSALLTSMCKYANVHITELSSNDIAGSRTVAQLQADLQTIWTRMAAVAPTGTKVWHTKILPRCTTTDRGVTLAGQTPLSAFVAGGSRDTMNAWYSTQIGTYLTGVIDIDTPARDATQTDRWASESFASTLPNAVTSGQTTGISIANAPASYATLVADPGGANQSSGYAIVTSISGTGPYTVTLQNGFGVAQTAGAAVKSTPSLDTTHPTSTTCANKIVPVVVTALNS